MNALAQTYATNIQIGQLKSVLPTELHTIAGLEQERKHFLFWLNEQFNIGNRYEDQVIAWEAYKLYIDFSEFDEEDLETNWMFDLEDAFERQIQSRNYNEYGGQQ